MKIFFQNTITFALNHEEMGKHPERISKIKPFINKCNYPSQKGDWKKLEKMI